MGNGDDPSSGDPSHSAQFPARRCPKCRGRDIPCDLCHGTTPESRFVSHFKAAAWFSEHPEVKITPADFPAVKQPPNESGDDGNEK